MTSLTEIACRFCDLDGQLHQAILKDENGLFQPIAQMVGIDNHDNFEYQANNNLDLLHKPGVRVHTDCSHFDQRLCNILVGLFPQFRRRCSHRRPHFLRIARLFEPRSRPMRGTVDTTKVVLVVELDLA